MAIDLDRLLGSDLSVVPRLVAHDASEVDFVRVRRPHPRDLSARRRDGGVRPRLGRRTQEPRPGADPPAADAAGIAGGARSRGLRLATARAHRTAQDRDAAQPLPRLRARDRRPGAARREQGRRARLRSAGGDRSSFVFTLAVQPIARRRARSVFRWRWGCDLTSRATTKRPCATCSRR